ncbi:MAG: helix-turn-helix domain-containing protein [Acidobacteria bacterium]|nr:helix-turn-helix domain-containing protein [Acidobacteriota bacterium]
MQALSSYTTTLLENRPYTPGVMPRKSTKTRPPQGMKLAELRKAAGLSQYELARYVGVPQANIAFWERSEKPPRSEVLPKMAQALGVTVEDLIVGDEKPLKKKAAKTNSRPAGKVREVFDRVSKLPRRQQEHIVNWVSAYVSHYEQNR